MNSLKDKDGEGSLNKLNAFYQQIADTSENVVTLYDVVEVYFI